MSPVRVACAQIAPELGALDANAARAQAAIDEALGAGADVVVLPELILSGYMFEDAEEAAALAIDAEHPILAGWARAATDSGAIVAGGFAERGADGRIYNSAVLYASERPGAPVSAMVYRKLHLWDRERLIFTPGEAVAPVIDTRVGRIGLLICYDLEFPELTRSLALAGAQLLLVPTNWPAEWRPEGERSAEVGIAMAAARVNRMAIACADRCGAERGQDWNQGTSIIGADGWVAAERRDPGLVVADLDLDLALDKSVGSHGHLFSDRRPGLYGSLIADP